MEEFLTNYREVIPDQTISQPCKDIALNTGASQSTLQDIKVAEKAGGYCYKDVSKIHNRNRFIYWRTNHDILELSEISLDLNLTDSNIRYKFADSPVLSVAIFENQHFVVILIATVNSIHRLSFQHPDKLHKTYGTGCNQAYSIFHDASTNSTRDPSTFYVIGHAASSSNYQIPHTASCWLLNTGQEALFALAYNTTLMLFTMNCITGQTILQELKQHNIVPRIISNITGALRGKSNSADSQYVTSLVFSDIGGQTFCYALYRDDNVRMWSTKTGQCIATLNCLQDGTDSRTQGPQSNLLRRASSSMICAFLCHSMGSEFVTIQTEWDGCSTYSLHRTHYITAPQYDLVDFEINDYRIWGLWCNSQGEFNISNYTFTPNSNWISTIFESTPDQCINVEHGTDPRQTYCSYIFQPGKFQRNVIAKALVMFRRANILSDANLPMSYLKDRVCQAVETEIQNEIKDYEITDEEYIDISSKFWERFYSCCEQYNNKACQPIGLVIMESVGAVCVVKKSTFSLLRPCEDLEHLMLGSHNDEIEQFGSIQLSSQKIQTKDCQGLVQLVTVLALLDRHILDDIKNDFDNKLDQLEIPDAVASKIVSDILASEYEDTILPRDFLDKLLQQIKEIPDLVQSMIMLLEALQMDHGEPQSMQMSSTLHSTRILQSIGNLFGSDVGISVVAESLRQIAVIRYSLCRSLLILQHILILTSDSPSNVLEVIRSRCVPETVVFVQAYHVMVWISETPAQSGPPSSSLESSIQRLSLMQISDSNQSMKRPQQPITLLELFLRGKGSQAGLSLLVENQYRNLSDPQWQYTLVPLVTIVGQLIWAVSGNFIFGEWLISSCQHILIQEYIRLLNSWCEWNNCSRCFIAAVSLLDNGENHKAFDLFMEASKGVIAEPFIEKISYQSNIEELSHDEAMVQYYLKVIQLFEQHSALDCVIELAKTAIGILDKTDPQMAMFQSIVFTNHLKLEHYTEAYRALTDNAESSQRKDCLRKLVVCLFEEKRLDLLMQFPYIHLSDDLVDIVESRARSMSIEGNNYYNFLYSFHVSNGNMRKASTIMYEQAMRFSLECETISAVQSRYESLISCLNTLHLIERKDAWIAKPIINDEMNVGNGCDNMDSELLLNQQITVLEIKDVKVEILLTEAILCLAKHRQEMNSILNADADQLIAVLANTGLYTSAIKLALGLRKPIQSVLESLASACIRANDENSNETWSWLQENDLADLPHKNNAVDMAWKLLQRLIDENELENSTILRKSVTNKILSLGEFLPQWLYLTYRQSNASELLRLYVNHGRLIEATQLAIEYISAMMKAGGEYFGLKNSINVAQAPLCFPIDTIDLLLYGLEINVQSGNEYRNCYQELQLIVDEYINTAERVSNDKIQMAAASSATGMVF